jgi:uncharacterized membrane protein (UPF0127 family)
VKYHLLNRSKQTVLAREVELADTSWTRLRGLLGRKSDEFTSGQGLWIVPSQGVHTLGMSFPIDVVYLDSKRRVIHLCHKLEPFRIAALKWRASSVIELPAGTLTKTGTSVGDELELNEIPTEGGVACVTAQV